MRMHFRKTESTSIMPVKKIMLLLGLCYGLFPSLQAQETISLQKAIEIGLENNFGIQIARNEAEISSINRSLGEAGFLPRVELIGEYSTNDDHFRLTDEITGQKEDIDEKSVYSGGQLSFELPIFQGFYRITNYKKLQELEQLGKVQANLSIENTLVAIATAYYNIVRYEKRIEVLQNTVEISQDRREIAETKFEVGTGSEYDLLVTTTDLNVDQTDVIREERMLYNARMELIQLLNLSADSNFQVQTDITLGAPLKLDQLSIVVMQENRSLQAARLQAQVAQLEEREIQSQRYPQISLGGAYNISNEDLKENMLHEIERRDGLFYGITARLNIFDGFRTNRQAKIARINSLSSELVQQEQVKNVETVLLSYFSDYESAIELIALEENNLELARKALDIAFERFRLGNITPVELRESQRTLLNTETRLITAMFEAKIYEIELLRLAGRLLDEYNILPL